jgi:glycerol-3-phosphate dehydrogenase (NAD(P)+)
LLAPLRIAVVGAGAWGTALGVRWTLAHTVTLITRRAEHASDLRAAAENTRYLPGIALPPSLTIATLADSAFAQAAPPDLLVLGVPTDGLVATLEQLSMWRTRPLIAVCKGFVGDAAALPAEVIAARWAASHGILSGPSFAQEVARGLPAALALASTEATFANTMAERLRDEALRIYPITDVVGVEIGGAVKNVLAIAAGLCDGLLLGHNARAALITRGLAEVTRLAVAMGGHAATLAGLAGMGDLVLTCTGDLSRNRRVGLALAEGKTLHTIVSELGHVAEGVSAAQKTVYLAKKFAVEMPISSAVAQLLAGHLTPREAVSALMMRETPRA